MHSRSHTTGTLSRFATRRHHGASLDRWQSIVRVGGALIATTLGCQPSGSDTTSISALGEIEPPSYLDAPASSTSGHVTVTWGASPRRRASIGAGDRAVHRRRALDDGLRGLGVHDRAPLRRRAHGPAPRAGLPSPDRRVQRPHVSGARHDHAEVPGPPLQLL